MTADEMPFHRYVGADDDPPDAICAACGVSKDRAIHDEKTAARHGGFQDWDGLIVSGPPMGDTADDA